ARLPPAVVHATVGIRDASWHRQRGARTPRIAWTIDKRTMAANGQRKVNRAPLGYPRVMWDPSDLDGDGQKSVPGVYVCAGGIRCPFACVVSEVLPAPRGRRHRPSRLIQDGQVRAFPDLADPRERQVESA